MKAFRYVTATCPHCGANKYHFDEKEQTFVCEYCGSEIYAEENADPVETSVVDHLSVDNEVYDEEDSLKESVQEDIDAYESEDDYETEETQAAGILNLDPVTRALLLCLIGGAILVLGLALPKIGLTPGQDDAAALVYIICRIASFTGLLLTGWGICRLVPALADMHYTL